MSDSPPTPNALIEIIDLIERVSGLRYSGERGQNVHELSQGQYISIMTMLADHEERIPPKGQGALIGLLLVSAMLSWLSIVAIVIVLIVS